MSRIFPGSRVEGRKPMRNPHTVSGMPRWNTYQGMDFMPTSFDGGGHVKKFGDNAKNHKDHRYTPCRKNGGGNKPKKIDPGNLCHRSRKTTGQTYHINQRHFEAARALIVDFSRDKSESHAQRFSVHMMYLQDRGAKTELAEVRRLVLARGCHQLLRFFK